MWWVGEDVVVLPVGHGTSLSVSTYIDEGTGGVARAFVGLNGPAAPPLRPRCICSRCAPAHALPPRSRCAPPAVPLRPRARAHAALPKTLPLCPRPAPAAFPCAPALPLRKVRGPSRYSAGPPRVRSVGTDAHEERGSHAEFLRRSEGKQRGAGLPTSSRVSRGSLRDATLHRTSV